MNSTLALEIGRETMLTALLVVAPVMITGFVVGISLSIIQAVMQIQEMTLTFVPKIISIVVALLIFGSWMIQKLTSYTHELLADFTPYIGF